MTTEHEKRNRFRFYRDYNLIIALAVIILFGLMMVYSSSYYTAQLSKASEYNQYYYLLRQAAFVGIGIFLLVIFTVLVPYRRVMSWLPIALYIGALVSMVLVQFTSMGITINNSKRWLRIYGSFQFQPTEVVKVMVIVVTAFVLVKFRSWIFSKFWHFLVVFIGILLPDFFVILNNLTSGIIIAAIVYFMMMIGAPRHLKKFFFIGLGLAAVFYIVSFMYGDIIFGYTNKKIGIPKDYQLMRIKVWLNPKAYAQDGGYQVLQGLYAIGSGGFFGKGLGNGVQKLGFVPEASNDMIFSIICEEMGLIGAIGLLALYGVLIYRLFVIAKKTNDILGFYLVTGVIIHIGLQVILNVSVVTGLIPNTGVSLPFVSYGGTSVLFLMSEMYLVFSVARQIPTERKAKKMTMAEADSIYYDTQN